MKISITNNIFHEGINLDGDFEAEFEHHAVAQIIIDGQVFSKEAKLSAIRLKHLLKEENCNTVRLVACNCCGKLFVENKINHDDFDVVEDIMES